MKQYLKLPAALSITALFVLLHIPWPSFADNTAKLSGTAISKQEIMKQGEKMYRDGLLPSGQPMQAFVQGDVPVDSSAFSCVSCHLRSGLGSVEGQVLTYPVDSKTLYAPMTKEWMIRWTSRSRLARSAIGNVRSAYTDESLATAIRGGINPDGKTLNYVMPRYPLEDKDMEIMISYLKNLSVEPSPGVTDKTIQFATIITDDVAPADREAALKPLQMMINTSISGKTTKMALQSRRSDPGDLMNKGYLNFMITPWELKGPPETWRSQLDAYYKAQPVFALLGGISTKEWLPIHTFCEDNQLPCILPLTDLPVVSERDWYTLYFSKGYYQEGEAAAKYINSTSDTAGDIPVIQIFRNSSAGKAAAKGFRDTWTTITGKAVANHMFSKDEPITGDFLKQLAAKNKKAAILLWLDSTDLASITSFNVAADMPDMLFLSYGLLKNGIYDIPETIRKSVYITYPYRLPDDFKKYEPLVGQNFKKASPEVKARMLTLYSTVPTAIFMMKGYFFRDRFLEVLDMMLPMNTMADFLAPDSPLYPKYSFGPGQRYIIKGCYVVQLTADPVPKVKSVSDWVIP